MLWLWSLRALVSHIRQEAIAYFLAGFGFEECASLLPLIAVLHCRDVQWHWSSRSVCYMWHPLLNIFMCIFFWVISGKCGFLWAEALLLLFVPIGV